MEKLRGVITTAVTVDIAVNDTESSMLPLEIDEIKLEMLPPGQHATNIAPSATVAVR